MDEATKITLSERELNKVQDSEWILTKYAIIQKACLLLNNQVDILNELSERFPIIKDTIPSAIPRIYKGENYLHLPYVTLDYPASFRKHNVMAVRTMFWWGNFFSITLHLSGEYKTRFYPRLISNLLKAPAGLFICTGVEEWAHHFEPGNYCEAITFDQAVYAEQPFIKIALKFELDHWNNMPGLLSVGYTKIFNLLED